MFFEDEEEKAERDALVKGIAAFFDSLNNHLTAQKYIFICALIDSFLLGAAFFFPKIHLQSIVWTVRFFFLSSFCFRLYYGKCCLEIDTSYELESSASWLRSSPRLQIYLTGRQQVDYLACFCFGRRFEHVNCILPLQSDLTRVASCWIKAFSTWRANKTKQFSK